MARIALLLVAYAKLLPPNLENGPDLGARRESCILRRTASREAQAPGCPAGPGASISIRCPHRAARIAMGEPEGKTKLLPQLDSLTTPGRNVEVPIT